MKFWKERKLRKLDEEEATKEIKGWPTEIPTTTPGASGAVSSLTSRGPDAPPKETSSGKAVPLLSRGMTASATDRSGEGSSLEPTTFVSSTGFPSADPMAWELSVEQLLSRADFPRPVNDKLEALARGLGLTPEQALVRLLHLMQALFEDRWRNRSVGEAVRYYFANNYFA